MRSPYRLVLSCIALSAFISTNACADGWPARVVAPYLYLPSLPDTTGTIGDRSFFTLAFVIADKHNEPHWDSVGSVLTPEWHQFIASVRARGGDCAVSFGGADGRELALAIDDPAKLEKAYAAVIDREQFTRVDFDVEGKTLEKQDVNRRRNAVIARLQHDRPALQVVFTLPAGTDGLERESIELLTDAKAAGVKVACVNAMVMDFGSDAVKHHPLIDCCTIGAEKAHVQVMKIDPTWTVGLTALIGISDNGPSETFTVDDATQLTAWAIARPWLSELSFWNVSRDRGLDGKPDDRRSGVLAKPFAFQNAMLPFQGK